MLLPLLAAVAVQLGAPADSGWVRDANVPIPMRDGTVLRADVLRPRRGDRFPVLVYRTPYGKDATIREYTTFGAAVQRGYAVVVQDVRGRYASDGTFDPYRQEGRDGFDTIEWAATQPWATGDVGTFGLSYPGAVQWLAALERPPHLRAMVPAMTFASARQFITSGGAWDLSWIAWGWNNIAPDARRRASLPGPRTGAEARAAYRREGARMTAHLPLATLPDLQDAAPWYHEWLRHPPDDPWWDFAELAGRYAQVDAAVLNLSGWHDEAYGPDGATRNFTGLVNARGGPSRTQLLIGPWVHGVDATADTVAGERAFGAAAAIDYDRVVLDFLDRWVRGIPNGMDTLPPVRAFAMGANAWRTGRTWPLEGTRRDTLWLQPGRRLEPQPPAARRAGTTFVADPSRPVTDPFDAAYGAHDFAALGARRDVLAFETAPFTTDVEVLGPIEAAIALETDAADLDLYVQVLDVHPDGRAFNLMSPGLGVQRASARAEAPGRLAPGQVHWFRLGDLLTGNRFRAGHRLRVHLMASFHPHFSRNLQTGASERTSSAMRAAEVTIRHDASHPSRLVLPVRGAQ